MLGAAPHVCSRQVILHVVSPNVHKGIPQIEERKKRFLKKRKNKIFRTVRSRTDPISLQAYGSRHTRQAGWPWSLYPSRLTLRII
jgi:endonuclease/exonuclease/phosphatase family metal-dependent hydrolase